MKEIRVNQQRLWDSHMELGTIGALPGGGCCRLALSDDDGLGRDLFVRWCKEAGCTVHYDQVGNIYARRPGKNSDLAPVATGSHLDTQPHGGKFDGIYGVLAGLEVIRTLNDHQIETQAPIEVIVWTNEEGARFIPPVLGSAAFAGKLDVDYIHQLKTFDNTRVIDDLKRIGYLGKEMPGAHPLNSFFEAHIEQGPVLENDNLTIGVVDRVQGMFEFSVTVKGQDGHAGTVPMSERRDAMMGAATMIQWLQGFAKSLDEANRITVGHLQVTPNSTSTIPGQVHFSIDVRHPELNTLTQCKQEIKSQLDTIAKAAGLEINIECLFDEPPVEFDENMISILESSTQMLGYSNTRMYSGAGHDAMNLAPSTPTAMIFVPCEKGISHNEEENATPYDLAAGTNVLLHAMLRQANNA